MSITSELRTGIVVTFGPDGWGRVRADIDDRSGAVSEEIDFHSTAIADGSRRIDVGTAVSFTVVAGRLGRWEAAQVTPR